MEGMQGGVALVVETLVWAWSIMGTGSGRDGA